MRCFVTQTQKPKPCLPVRCPLPSGSVVQFMRVPDALVVRISHCICRIAELLPVCDSHLIPRQDWTQPTSQPGAYGEHHDYGDSRHLSDKLPDVPCSGYGSPSEDFELSTAPVVRTVSGNQPEQVSSSCMCDVLHLPILAEPEASSLSFALNLSSAAQDVAQRRRHVLGCSLINLLHVYYISRKSAVFTSTRWQMLFLLCGACVGMDCQGDSCSPVYA